ncbi:DNA-directed RNA polymerase III subunit C1 (rpo31) [Sporothrix curviconia]|uniref:DNA-directed RNA polymerase III subunit C1 (Rpo31) n=1 Tax=Sporothrix curviconia TaxID=1260050 RepID=A0ABP0B8L8_9PEZI
MAASGREAQVDTAIKRTETGFVARRFIKSPEDLSGQSAGAVGGDNKPEVGDGRALIDDQAHAINIVVGR